MYYIFDFDILKNKLFNSFFHVESKFLNRLITNQETFYMEYLRKIEVSHFILLFIIILLILLYFFFNLNLN